ncbi:FAD-binding oxidoreductase [Chitinophaga niabensis]|uniref:NAD(P)/FAD-dependent oxidoreductase n=1 Tax=Chitinophaga niabensis TaxID=536979 RepID=UPI0031BA33B8
MDLHSGYPYSLIRHGLPFNYPKLENDLRASVVVIGGGISGALMAHALVREGITCVVLDARTVGLGSTSASTSLLQYEIDVPLTELKEKVGVAHAERAYAACARSIDKLEKITKRVNAPYFERKHSLYLASFKKDLPKLEAEYKARKAMGLDVMFWDPGMLKDLLGLDAPAAIYSRTAAQTDAYSLTHALHQYNLEKGAAVYDRTLVQDISFPKNGVRLTTEEGHTVLADHLVIATGYETLQYLPAGIVDLHATYAVASEHHEKGPLWYEDCLIWEMKDPYLYLRTTPEHRIIVGGRDEKFYNPTKRDKLLPAKARQLQQDFSKHFPHIPFKPEFKWTGTFGSTQDGLPYIGTYAKMPHTFFALGFGGNGITFSQIAAEIVCDQIRGKQHPDADVFSFARYKG